jgi:hypothetical protein
MKTIQKGYFKCFAMQTICLYEMLETWVGGNGFKVVCVDPWIVLLFPLSFEVIKC